MNDITMMAWRGWYRVSKKHSWELVCQGDDYSTCWGELLAKTADQRSRFAELLVSQRDPNDAAPGPRMRRRF